MILGFFVRDDTVVPVGGSMEPRLNDQQRVRLRQEARRAQDHDVLDYGMWLYQGNYLLLATTQ